MKARAIIKSFWNEFVCGGHLLSLGAASIVYTSAVLLSIRITWDCLLVAYLGCQIVYLYNRYKEFNKDALTNPERTEHIRKSIKYALPIIVIFIVAILGIFVYFHKVPVLIFGAVVLSLSLLYSQFLKKLTRKLVGFKTFFVSFMWALLVVFLSFYYSHSLNLAVFLIFLFIFLRFLVSTTFFDIKDIESDKKDGLLTLPIILNKHRIIYLLIISSFLAVIPIFFGVFLNLFPKFSIILSFTFIYTVYYLSKAYKININSAFLNYVIVDGEFILWSVFILVGKAVF